MKKTMNYDHPQWKDFLDELSGALDEANCLHDHDLTWTLLVKYEADIEKSIGFFRSHGGYCDCEIMFNVVKPDVEITGALMNPN